MGNINIKCGGNMIHDAIGSIEHKAVLKIQHTAAQIGHSALAKIGINGPMVNVSGINKNLLAAGGLLNQFKSMTGLQGMLSQVQNTFGGALGLGGLTSQLGSITSSLGGLTSITGAFAGITSLAGGLTQFTSLGGILQTLGAPAGLMENFTGQLDSITGALGSLGGSGGAAAQLSQTQTLAPVATNLTNLSTASSASGVSASLTAHYNSINTISDTLATATLLQALGVQMSTAGSGNTVDDIKTLMEDINNLLTSSAFTDAVSNVGTQSTSLLAIITALQTDLTAVQNGINAL